jgi:hypothetical protein
LTDSLLIEAIFNSRYGAFWEIPEDLIGFILHKARIHGDVFLFEFPVSVTSEFMDMFAGQIYVRFPRQRFVMFREDFEYTLVNDYAGLVYAYCQGIKC